MEVIGIILLASILVMGCIIFYLFLQFNRVTNQVNESDRLIKQSLEKINRKLDDLSKNSG